VSGAAPGGPGSTRRPEAGDRKESGEARRLRPLNTPSPVTVRTDGDGRPVGVAREDRILEVLQLREVWRIDDEWWRQPVSRLYFDLVLEDGRRIVLYRDLAGGGWYRQEE